MSIKEDLNTQFKDAMRAKDELLKFTLRSVLAAIKQTEVDQKKELEDADIVRLIQKEVKSQRETIEDAQKASRLEMIEEAEARIKILETFLPKALSTAELEVIIKKAVADSGASSLAEMGNVMKLIMPQVAGKADGSEVSRLVREALQK
ncbi:MAG: GatB/YqeY domain-containing protein [Anaerolineales bacterium]|nr:GatB/YqeY domain-containing protein [Anaerolineales bacterium]